MSQPPLNVTISVLVANYNGAATIAACLRSILSQTLAALEVLVVDDASVDDSAAIVAGMAARDPRVRMFAMPTNGGPAAARNRGLDEVRGRWIAVVDADDLIHPERLQRLVTAADAAGVEIAADNLLVFDDANIAAPYAFMDDATLPRPIALADYVGANVYGAPGLKLGYLKPIFRADFVRRSGVRYSPALRIAEDFGFVLALLAAGARFHLFPGMTYFYRKHAGSISHRLQAADVAAMVAEDARFLADQPALPAALVDAFARRRCGFMDVMAFDTLVRALKARRWAAAAAIALRRPRAAVMLRQTLAARLARRHPVDLPARPQVCLIGSVAPPGVERLTALAAALSRGHDVHLVVTTALPARQRRKLAVRSPFASILAATRSKGPQDNRLYVARAARPVAGILIVEWQPGADIVPYVLRPDALTLLLVHNLPTRDAVGLAGELARADAILADNPDDAAAARAWCPDTPMILLPGGQILGDLSRDTRLAAFVAAVTPPLSPAAPSVPGPRTRT